jgi:hypothetical protein
VVFGDLDVKNELGITTLTWCLKYRQETAAGYKWKHKK